MNFSSPEIFFFQILENCENHRAPKFSMYNIFAGKAIILQGEGMEGPQKRKDTKFDWLGKT